MSDFKSGLHEVWPLTGLGLIFQITRLHPVSSAEFETVGRCKRQKTDDN